MSPFIVPPKCWDPRDMLSRPSKALLRETGLFCSLKSWFLGWVAYGDSYYYGTTDLSLLRSLQFTHNSFCSISADVKNANATLELLQAVLTCLLLWLAVGPGAMELINEADKSLMPWPTLFRDQTICTPRVKRNRMGKVSNHKDKATYDRQATCGRNIFP